MSKAKVFKNTLEAAFKAAEKAGGKKLFRREPIGQKVSTFDEAKQFGGQSFGGMSDKGEPGGLYYAEHPYDLPALITGAGISRTEARSSRAATKKIYPGAEIFDTIAIPVPGSRTKSYDLREWNKVGRNKPFKELTEELKKKLDFVSFPDSAAGNYTVNQTVQLNPKKALTRYTEDKGQGKKTKYALVGLGTVGMLAGQAFSAKDAEAISPNAYWKAVKPLFKEVGATRKEQARVAQSILNLPKKDVDTIRNVDIRPMLSSGPGQNPPTARLTRDFNNPNKLEADVEYNRDNFRTLFSRTDKRYDRHVMQTPAHEVSHLTLDRAHFDLDAQEKTAVVNALENAAHPAITSRTATNVGNSANVNLTETFSEALSTASPEMYTPATLDFLASLRKRMGGRDFRIVKPAVAAAAVGTGMMLSAEPADAMPLGKPLKGAWKTFGEAMRSKTPLGEHMRKAGQKVPAVSSSSERLVGQPLRGSKISGVYQGIGDKRYIHLEDGRVFPTDKKSVHELAAEFGTRAYVNKFAGHAGEATPGTPKWDQILKSLEMNETRGIPPRAGGSKPKRIEILENSLLDRQGMLQDELADQVLVQSMKSKKWWLWPRVYAEPAEAAGLVRIDRAKKTLFTNKGLRDDN